MDGQAEFQYLSNELDIETYALHKTIIWIHLLNHGKAPKKWNASKQGTVVSYKYIESEKDYDLSFIELELFVKQVKERTGINYDNWLHRKLEAI